jgi:hypothetical protein
MIIMMIFNMSISYFHKILFHYFEDYLTMNLTLKQGNMFIRFFSPLFVKLKALNYNIIIIVK